MLNIEDVTTLYRVNDNVYCKICSLKTIRHWGLEVSERELIQDQSVLVGYNTIKIMPKNLIQIDQPLLLSLLPLGKDEEEYPVIFVNLKHHLPTLIEGALLKNTDFSKLIERTQKISKNSTKVLTLAGLREILVNVFDKGYIDYHSWDRLIRDFEKYIKTLMLRYPYLSYLPIKDRKNYKAKFVGDLNFAWEMYFKYFYNSWRSDPNSLRIPPLEGKYQYGDFKGDYFDRENPMWAEILGLNTKFIFNKVQKDLIYMKWEQWLGEL